MHTTKQAQSKNTWKSFLNASVCIILARKAQGSPWIPQSRHNPRLNRKKTLNKPTASWNAGAQRFWQNTKNTPFFHFCVKAPFFVFAKKKNSATLRKTPPAGIYCVKSVVFFLISQVSGVRKNAGLSVYLRKTRPLRNKTMSFYVFFPRQVAGKHRKTRCFLGFARPKPAFRRGWRAKTRVLTRPAGEKHVK